MSSNQLAKFFATVGFKVDTSGFDSAVAKVRKDVAALSKSVSTSQVAKQVRQQRQNLRFEEQKAAYRKQEEAGMLKHAAFLNKEDTYKKRGVALREKANSFAEKLRNTESAQALKNIQAKRTAAKVAEQASTKELSNMGDFYRKQEDVGNKLHTQALRDNNRLSQARIKANSFVEKLKNSESVKALRNIQTKRQQAFKGQLGSAKELSAMSTYYRKQEQAFDKLHGQALRDNLKFEQMRTREINRRSTLQRRSAQGQLNAMTTGAVGGMTARGALGSLGAGAFAQQSFKVAQFSTAREPQYEFLTGSKEKAKEQIQFIDKEVDRLSLNLGQANEQYKNLLAGGGDAIGIEKTQKLFTSFSELSTMLGTSTDQQNRGLRAFTQMLSKGQVMSEELKGQLAENLPGAVKMFADSLTEGDISKLFKMMEGGKVGLKEIEKVIDHMKDLVDPELLEKMANTPAKKFEKMRTAWVRMLEATNDSGMLSLMVKVFDEMAIAMKTSARWIRLNKEGLESFGNAVGKVWIYTKTALAVLLPYWKQIIGLLVVGKMVKFTAAMWTLHTGVKALTLAMSKLLLRVFLIPVAIGLALAALVDISDALSGNKSFLKDWAKDDSWYSGFARFVLLLSDAAKYATILVGSGIVEAWGQITSNDALVQVARNAQTQELNRSTALTNDISPRVEGEANFMRDFFTTVKTMFLLNTGMLETGSMSDVIHPSMFSGFMPHSLGTQSYLPAMEANSQQTPTVTNHITVNAPTREGSEIARAVTQSLSAYPLDK